MTLQYKVNFGLQIAYAMKFLSDNGVIHPDLALRNCLWVEAGSLFLNSIRILGQFGLLNDIVLDNTFPDINHTKFSMLI